jgi:hypothetical protein
LFRIEHQSKFIWAGKFLKNTQETHKDHGVVSQKYGQVVAPEELPNFADSDTKVYLP